MRKALIILALSATTVLGSAQESFTVDDCVRLGLQNSVEVRNAALDVRAARLQKQEALAEYFPSISAMGIGFYSMNPMIDITITDILGTSDMAYQIRENLEQSAAPYGINTRYTALQHGYSASLSLMQPVFAGGRIVTGNQLASLGIRAASAKNELQQRETGEQIQKLFYQVLALQEKDASLQSASRLLDSLMANVSSAVAAGLAVESDLASVKIKQNELKAGRSKLDLGLRLAKMNLFNTIGVEYNAYRSLQSEKPSIDSLVLVGSFGDIVAPEEVYVDESEIAAGLGEMELLQMQVDAKELERRMTLGSTLPSVMVGASYGYSKMLATPNGNGMVYAVLQIPISDWGKNSRKMDRQRIAVEQARNQRDFLQEQLVLKVRQLYMELCCAYDQMQLAEEAEEISKTRFHQMESSYAAGMCTLAELLQSETELRSAEDSRIDATLSYLTALESYRMHQHNR